MVVKHSPRLAILLLLLHMVAAILVYATGMPLQARLLMLLLISLSLVYYQARDVFLLLPYSWREISLENGGISVVTRDGSKLPGRLANDSTVSPCFILLRVRQEGRYLPVSRIIFPDALEAGAFREFCVRLKFS